MFMISRLVAGERNISIPTHNAKHSESLTKKGFTKSSHNQYDAKNSYNLLFNAVNLALKT